MSSKKHQIPSIRFEGFTNAWEQRELGELVSKAIDNRGKTPPTQEKGIYPLLEIASIGGFFPDYSKVSKYVDDDTYNTWFRAHLKENDILFSTVGNTGLATLMDNFEGATVAQNIVGFRAKNSNVPEFLLQMFKLPRNLKKAKRIEMGAVQPSIKVSQLIHVRYQVPTSKKEQIKIGCFFKHLDDTIALHQRQQDNYKQLKKYMLQKIFNQEFRFKDENGNDYPDWEEIALKELGETFTGLSGKTKENFGKGKGKFVTYMNVFSNSTANLAMTENVEIEDGEKQNEVRYGDIFFTTSSETPDEVGMSSVWLSHESNVYLNSFCFGYRLNSESEGKVTHQFLGVQLRADHIRKQIVFLAQGSTRFNISKAKLTEIPVYLPAIQEQQKIADFLSMLDLRIEQLSQKVELLKEQKKGLIQQMFV